MLNLHTCESASLQQIPSQEKVATGRRLSLLLFCAGTVPLRASAFPTRALPRHSPSPNRCRLRPCSYCPLPLPLPLGLLLLLLLLLLLRLPLPLPLPLRPPRSSAGIRHIRQMCGQKATVCRRYTRVNVAALKLLAAARRRPLVAHLQAATSGGRQFESGHVDATVPATDCGSGSRSGSTSRSRSWSGSVSGSGQ
jgi:hypothetical protein